MFVILRSDGKYATVPKGKYVSTSDIRKAWLFESKEEAEIHRCFDDECVVSVESEFKKILNGMSL